MLRFASGVSSLMFLSSVVSAQDGWAPPIHTRHNGNQGFAMPGNWSIGRSQAIIKKADLPANLLPGKVLTKIAYRRTNYPSVIPTTYVGKPMVCEVSVGNTGAGALGLVWAANIPGDVLVVMPMVGIRFPNDPPIGAFNETGPDIMVFPFAVPKVFVGPNLFIEHRNNMPPAASTVYWSDVLDNRATTLHGHNAVRGGFGCGVAAFYPTNLRAALVTNSDNPLPGATTYNLANATPSTVFLLTVGVELINPYLLPAPFDLAFLGAPGCPFWNTLDVIITGVTTAGGTGSTTVPWMDLGMKGAEVGIQAFVVSPGFNAADLTTSNGIDAWIGARYPLTSSFVLEFNNLASVAAPPLNLYIGAIPITHLFWR